MFNIIQASAPDQSTYPSGFPNEMDSYSLMRMINEYGGFNDIEIKQLNKVVNNLYSQWSMKDPKTTWVDFDADDAEELAIEWKDFLTKNADLQKAKGVVVDYDEILKNLEAMFPTIK